ncbi:class I adenylate-forming enzyme family protein [Neopusillimonas maritima]|uniref:Cyclohexanecarboxylate-CoA ligase n=1 Tax=Neopusillimonas maritima TaxID=2026239 RepID=A0ABX9MWW5_9BURK|nr:class I adenylate-forming enzyme family protein [Neopusillimonas maritima]RII83413.1 cyclohexanecarboxylate-CoA ligase [Neopusillimonas maritima]
MNTLLTMHNPRQTRAYYASGVWQNDTFYTLLEGNAKRYPEGYAVRDKHRRLTWPQFQEEVTRVAGALHQLGLRRGDRVAVWLPSCVESVVIFLACSRNGYVCCPSLHKNHTVQDIVNLLNQVRCKVLFTQPGYAADLTGKSILDRIADIPSLKQIMLVGEDGAQANVPGPAAGSAEPAPVSGYPAPEAPLIESPVDDDPDKVLYLAFTSGTTGNPKGVMHSDNTLLANGRAMVADWGHTADTIMLTLSAMSHHIGTVALEQSIVTGAELVVSDSSDPAKWMDWILVSKATYLLGVPTHGIDLLKEARTRNLKSLGDVEVFYLSGSVIPPWVAQEFFNLGVKPQNTFGMSENGSHHYTQPADSEPIIVGTCGRCCQGYETRIWRQDNPDVEAETGEIGELGGRGGLLMLGYFDNQTATETSFNNQGWFLTGDLGTIDESGCLRIVGRKKEMVIRGGRNIYPGLIEDLAHSYPLIRKAAVFPVPDPRLGEKACLALIWEGTAAPDYVSILQYLYENGLSKYDMPEYILVVDAFPMTASGKILKRELTRAVVAGEFKPEPVHWRANRPRTEVS